MIVRTNEPIATWQDGDFAQGFALVSRKEFRQDKRGRDYIDLELTDASGSMIGKIWPDSPAMKGHFREKDFVAIKGTVKLFRDQLQVSIDHVRPANESDRGDGFDPDQLIPTAPGGIDTWWQRLEAIFPDELQRSEMQLLAEETLRRYGDALRVHPAAKTIHHAYRGGLLQHVVQMSELALDLCGRYPEVDRDLVLLGVLYHDLGKLEELGPMPDNDYTLEGQLLGHIVIGQNMLHTCCRALDGVVPDRLRLHLEHLILSHHGKREYGSPVEPTTLEAWVLHSIDLIDSKINQLRAARATEGEGVHFLRRTNMKVFFDPHLDSADGDRDGG